MEEVSRSAAGGELGRAVPIAMDAEGHVRRRKALPALYLPARCHATDVVAVWGRTSRLQATTAASASSTSGGAGLCLKTTMLAIAAPIMIGNSKRAP